MKKILYVVNVVLILLVFILFYRVNKSDENLARYVKITQKINIINLRSIFNERSISIGKLTYNGLNSQNDGIKSTTYKPFKTIRLLELNCDIINGEFNIIENFYYAENLKDFNFCTFSSKEKKWIIQKRSNGSNKPVFGGKHPYEDNHNKIILIGEDPKTAKDIRNRN
jgi:hypothetical protein